MRAPCWIVVALQLFGCAPRSSAPEPAPEPVRVPPQDCWGFNAECRVGGRLRTAARVDPVPPAIAAQFRGEAVRAFGIDVDQDGRLDYLVQAETGNDGSLRNCFVDGRGPVRGCWPGGVPTGFAYYWFADLDGRPPLELFAMDGDEDSSDYWLDSLDPATWKPTRLFEIDPVLRRRGAGGYWGYPWDVRGLAVDGTGTATRILVAPGGILPPSPLGDESGDVYIVFDGQPSQDQDPFALADVVRQARWIALSEAKRMAQQTRSRRTAGPRE